MSLRLMMTVNAGRRNETQRLPRLLRHHPEIPLHMISHAVRPDTHRSWYLMWKLWTETIFSFPISLFELGEQSVTVSASSIGTLDVEVLMKLGTNYAHSITR